MRDRLIFYAKARRPVSDAPTADIVKLLAMVKSGEAKRYSDDCTPADMIARLEIELLIRENGL